MNRLYQPAGATVLLAASAVSARVALPATQDILRIFVVGDNPAFLAFGDDTVVAAIPTGGSPRLGMPIGAGRETGITPPAGATHVAAICAAGEIASLYVTAGAGI